MTEYTLAQVIDKFGRNTNLKFEYAGEKSNKIDFGISIHLSEDGRVTNEEGELILSNFTLNSKFRLINALVDRMTAFRALGQGKTIYCEYEGVKRTYIPFTDEHHLLENDNGEAVTVEEILYGKWFIGEE